MQTQKTYIFTGNITAVQPLATCSKDLADREGGEYKPVPVPKTTTPKGVRLMFPSTGLKGTIRRAARDTVRDGVTRVTGNEKPFSLDEHYLLTLGGIKGEGEQERSSVAHEAEWRVKNPVLSIFGAGDAGFLSFVQGRISISNAICVDADEPVVFSGARTDDLYRDKSQIAYLSDTDVESLIRKARGGKDRSAIKSDIKKLELSRKAARRAGNAEDVTAIEGSIEALNADLAAVKESSGTSDVSIGMPLAGWQAIPQGAVMDHSMHLVRSTPVELGLLLKSLGRVAQHPFIGAHFTNGSGQISATWEVFEASLEGKKSLGRISLIPFEPLDIDGPELTNAVAAFDAFIDSKEWNFGIPAVK